nr:hypothetical protein [Helicobacter pylori]
MISLFKESIDKVFDRVSAFTFEKYKEKTTMNRTMRKTTESLEKSKQ